MPIFVCNYLISNINVYLKNFNTYFLIHIEDPNNYFILWTISRNTMKVISLLYVNYSNIVCILHHPCIQHQSYSFIVLLIYTIFTYFFSEKLFLEVNICNYKGLSLYYWLGNELIQQTLIFLNQKYIFQLKLANNKKTAKNFWRRLLIISS